MMFGHTAEVRSMSWAPDSERLATFSDDGTLKVWNTITGTEVLSLRDDSFGALGSLIWTSNGRKLVAITADDESVIVFDSQPGLDLAKALFATYPQ